jgi:transposase-like protein
VGQGVSVQNPEVGAISHNRRPSGQDRSFDIAHSVNSRLRSFRRLCYLNLRPGRLSERSEEMRRLRQQVKTLAMERELLKKATAFFASLHR